MTERHLRRGFTLNELVVLIVLLALVLLLPGLMKQRWNASGLDVSLNNVRQILQATAQYRLDNAGRTPMRGCRYSAGMITGGWDTWNAFGKNCDSFWQSYGGGVFDESARGRALNSYLQSQSAPVPTGYLNTGAGATWSFNSGTPTPAQRLSFEVKKCRSPGDVATRQRTWPIPTPGVSNYNDVGTSYLLNMKWWDQPGLPANFTQRYNAGTEKIRVMPSLRSGSRASETFAWISDSIGNVVANTTGNSTGEFGGTNMSVLGFLSGHAAYTTLTPGALSGPGYTFGIPWP